jgi:multiple sugar transport system ATP-binding protein
VTEIRLVELSKVYADGTKAVSSLNVDIADGEFVVFVGPSGCGKTTALRMVAGLEEITSGTVEIGGRVVNNVPPKDRDIAMVFQNYALYPHMSVFDNMAFALRRRGVAKAEVERRAHEAAQILALIDVMSKRPGKLSGGQRQRAAMGRAIVREPQAFLMDEPLSNLDAKLRNQMRAEIARIQRSLAVTTIYVTHDQSEAMTLSDRVAVMRGGELQQVSRPAEIYDRPENLFVAAFIGSPPMNLVEAEIVVESDRVSARIGAASVALDQSVVQQRPALRVYDGRRVALGIRPEDLSGSRQGADSSIPASIDIRENLGSEYLVHFALAAPRVLTDEIREAAEAPPEDVEPIIAGDAQFVARVPRDDPAAEGSRIDLSFDSSKLYFFDLETGRAIYNSM